MQAIAFFAIIAVAAAAPSTDAEAQVVRNEADVKHDSFVYSYETSNGIVAQETGQLKEFGKDQAGVVTKGSYAYKTPEGVEIKVNYVADENGFQPTGDVLPVAPPVPAAIARAVEYILAHPSKDQH